jgi:hypothetical protein
VTASSTTERRALRGAVRQKAASPGNRQRKAVPGFAVGDIYLAAMPDLSEVEVEDVVPAAQTIKIKGHGWIDLPAFEEAVKARLGRVIYTSGLLGLKRKFIRET